MKAITLYQPYATLMAFGVKIVETRDWATKLREEIAIHAAAAIPRWVLEVDFGEWTIEQDNPRGAEPAYLLRGPGIWPYRLPLGAVVAKCRVVDMVSTSRCWAPGALEPASEGRVIRPEVWGTAEHVQGILGEDDLLDVSDQLPYGDFGPDRYAWVTRDRKPFTTPIPASGGQKIWNWTEAA